MAKKRLQPGPDLLLRVDKAFLEHGYRRLTMLGLAEACGFTARALYYYFANKEQAFRAAIRYHNDVSLSAGFSAGRAVRADGGNALDVFAEIMNIRFGATRRKANASRHLVELNAEVFKRCNDIVTAVALAFEAELARLIVEIEGAGLLKLRAGLKPELVAQALANGARAVNQRLPPVAPRELASHYREMCGFILYGCAEIPALPERAERKVPARKAESERA